MLVGKLEDFTCGTSPLLVLHLDEVDLLKSGLEPAKTENLLNGFLRSASGPGFSLIRLQ